MELVEAVLMARRLSGLSVEQLAQLAAIPAEGLREIEAGRAVPDFDTFDDLMLMAGYQMSFGALVPRCDLDAVRAARLVLDETPLVAATEASDRVAAEWLRRGIVDPSDIAWRAGRGARISIRPGARQFSWRPVVPALLGSRLTWALSGRPSAPAGPQQICYVDDVAAAADLMQLSDTRTGPLLTLLPLDEVAGAGIRTDRHGCRWVAPAQAWIDSLAGADAASAAHSGSRARNRSSIAVT